MERWLGRYSEQLYAVLRVVLGLLFACHGVQKVFGLLGGQSELGNPVQLAAGIIELLGGGMVALGLWTSYAAFVSSGTMAVAYFMAHGWRAFWPIVNKGELAAVYAFVFLFVAARGSGPLSVDALMGKQR